MSNLWIVKDAFGQIQGPFETSEVLIQIKNEILTGDEQIASYPEGAWQQISAEPEFFNYMLAVLSGTEAKNEEEKEQKSDLKHKTIKLDERDEIHGDDESKGFKVKDILNEAKPIFPENMGEEHQDLNKDEVSAGDELLSPPPKAFIKHREIKGRLHLFEDRQALTVDRLEELKEKSKKREKNKKFLYLILVIGIGLFISLLFIEDKAVKKSDRYRFILPEKSKFKVTDSVQKKESLTKAIELIQSDLVLNIMKGQVLLNGVLSYEPRNKTSLLLLCGSYLRLWEYTSKTVSDLYVVSEVGKRVYQIGSNDDAMYVCKLTEMILRGKNAEASLSVNSYLNSEGMSGEHSFYLRYFKGLLLYMKRNYHVSASFLESSLKIKKEWIPSWMLLGMVYNRQNRSQEAYNVFKRVLQLSPNHPEALFQLTILNIEVFSKFKIGLKYFKKALKVTSKGRVDKHIQSKAYASVAKVYFKKGKTLKAEKFARTAFDLDQSNILAKNILIFVGAKADSSFADKYIIAEANILYNAKEWEAAIAMYEKAYKINPRNSFTALQIANCYWNRSFIKDAIKWAELAVAANPKDVEAYIILAKFLINQYRLVDAARVLMKAKGINKLNYKIYTGFAQIEFYRKNYQRALKFAKEALRIYSNNVDASIISIKALKKLGEIEKAYVHASTSIEVNHSSFELENLYVELLMKTQGLDFAEEYINDRIKVFSGDLKYQIILANVYIQDQQYEKAAKIVQRANELLEWESWDGIITYANAMRFLGKLERALDSYERAYLMKPTKINPLFESGVMFTKNLKPNQAIKQFKRVKRANPLFPDLLYQWARAVKLLAEKKQDPKIVQEAIDLCKQELLSNPSHFESYLIIAESYHLLGNIARNKIKTMNTQDSKYSETYSEMISWYKLCAKNYQKSIDKAVQSGEVYIDMARCYRLSGALDQARASAIVAESLDKTNPRIWLEIAQIYEQQGGYREALKAYENFLLIYPNAPNKKDIENRLNKLKSMVEGK